MKLAVDATEHAHAALAIIPARIVDANRRVEIDVCEAFISCF